MLTILTKKKRPLCMQLSSSSEINTDRTQIITSNIYTAGGIILDNIVPSLPQCFHKPGPCDRWLQRLDPKLPDQTILSDWPYWQGALCCPAAELKHYVHLRGHLSQGNLPDIFTDINTVTSYLLFEEYFIVQIDKLEGIQSRGSFFFQFFFFRDGRGERSMHSLTE